MINHLLSEELEGEEDGSTRDSAVSRLSSVSRPSWSTPLGTCEFSMRLVIYDTKYLFENVP